MAVVVLSFARPAMADPAASTSDESRTPAISLGPTTRIDEEITVSPEKHPESLDRVPLSMTALDGDKLSILGVTDAQSLENVVPNLTVGSVPWDTQVNIRGIGNENLGIGGDPGVAFHVDGIYLGQSSGSLYGFYDVDRVEVLRGPQGTLYGRNATGGVINIVSRSPTDEIGGDGDVSYGNFDHLRADVAVNVPIESDVVLSRVSVLMDVHDGFQDNRFPAPHDIDTGDARAIRGQLLVKPSNEFDVLVRAYAEQARGTGPTPKIRGDYPKDVPLGVDPSTGAILTWNPYEAAAPNPSDPRKSNLDTDGSRDDLARGLSAEVHWKLVDSIELVSLAGIRSQSVDTLNDADGSELDLTSYRNAVDAHQVSEEVRLSRAATTDLPWYWLLGFYFFHEHSSGYGLLPMTFLSYLPLDPSLRAAGDVETDSYAVFGQTSYALTDQIKLGGGLRYSNDQKDGSKTFTFGLLPPFSPADSCFPNGGGFCRQFDESWGAVTGDVDVEYSLSERDLLYARAARGYKSGGINVASPQGPYDPEYVWAYELGARDRWLDGAVRTSLSLFYEDYRDLQVFQLIGNFSEITNAAKATIWGAELEWSAQLTRALAVDGGIGLLDATFDRYTNIDGADPTVGPQDLSGNVLPRSPRCTLGLGVEYRFSLGRYGSLTPRAQTHWQAQQFFRPFNQGKDRQAPYSKTDLRLVYEPPQGHWNAQLFVENLENHDVVGDIFVGLPSLGSPFVAFYEPPRLYGFAVGYHFVSL